MTFSRRAAVTGALALIGMIAAAVAAPLAFAAGPAAVSIVDKTFQPADLTVNVGDTVTWTVTQAIADPHSVTSGTGSSDPDSGKLFNSDIKLKVNGDSFQFTFTTAGTFAYYCQVHPTVMTGTITVTGAAGSGPPPASQGPAASAAPPTGAPAASGGTAASGAPAASGGPAASIIPGEEHAPVPSADKIAAAGILVVVLVLLFGSALAYRRINR